MKLLKRSQIMAVLALGIALSGFTCSQAPEVIARDAIVGAKAALDTEKGKHPECATPAAKSTTVCSLLSKATGAKDVSIDALEAYCSGPSFDTGGACNPPAKGTPAATQALNKLSAAISNMNQTVADAKKAGGN